MGNTRDTGYLRNLITYDGSGNVILPANLTVTGSLLANGGGSYATQSYVTTQISNLVNGAPGLLDTLDELAAALGDDANFAATLTTSLSGKQASLSGTGFVKISGTTISYDNSTYLTTSSAASTYLPLVGGTLTGLLLGTSSTFSGIITANSQTTAANGSINIESSDPAVRFRVTGGTANNRIYEWRSAAAGGVNNFMELRLWNDAQSSATTLFSVTSAGTGRFLTSVNATNFVSNITNGYGLLLNRPATTNYNGISYQTVNSAQWFVGMRENGTNNYIVYNENGTDALIISKANSNVGIRTNTPYSPLTITGDNISWGETMTIYPAVSGYTTLSFRLEGTDTTTGTWAIGKESSIGGNTSTQFLQVVKNSLTGSSLYRTDAVQSWDINGNTLFGFKVGINNSSPTAALSIGAFGTGFASSTPTLIDLGSVYGSNASGKNQKIKLWSNNTSDVFTYGLGVSSALLEITTATDGSIAFFRNGITPSELGRFTNSGSFLRPLQPAFLAYSDAGGISMTAGGWQNISSSMYIESYDIGSNYSSGRFTAPVAGRYFIYAGGWSSIGTASNGERYALSAVINGSGLTFISGGNYCLTDSPLASYQIVYNLAAGDYVELQAFTAVGGTWGAGTHRLYWGAYLL